MMGHDDALSGWRACRMSHSAGTTVRECEADVGAGTREQRCRTLVGGVAERGHVRQGQGLAAVDELRKHRAVSAALPDQSSSVPKQPDLQLAKPGRCLKGALPAR